MISRHRARVHHRREVPLDRSQAHVLEVDPHQTAVACGDQVPRMDVAVQRLRISARRLPEWAQPLGLGLTSRTQKLPE
jgi:hypothetical protein